MQTTAASAGVFFIVKNKSTLYKTCLIVFNQNFYSLTKKDLPCGLIMYSTAIVHNQTQPRKSWGYSTKNTPGIPPY